MSAPAESVTGLLFSVAGFLAVFLGQWWLGMSSIIYGFLDYGMHECKHSQTPHTCMAGFFYDMGLLQFLDAYFQRLVALYSLTAFMFRHGLVRAVARATLTMLTFIVTSDESLSTTEADLAYIGMYIGMWIFSRALQQMPDRRQAWVYASLLVSGLGFFVQHGLDHATHVSREKRRILVCAAHVLFSLDIVFVALALRPLPHKHLKHHKTNKTNAIATNTLLLL
jgi:hypothetical protein